MLKYQVSESKWFVYIDNTKGREEKIFEWRYNLREQDIPGHKLLERSIVYTEQGLPRWPKWWRTHLQLRETKETQFDAWTREDPLKEEMATHCSILAWRTLCRGTWRATVRGVAKSQTRREQLSTHAQSRASSQSGLCICGTWGSPRTWRSGSVSRAAARILNHLPGATDAPVRPCVRVDSKALKHKSYIHLQLFSLQRTHISIRRFKDQTWQFHFWYIQKNWKQSLDKIFVYPGSQ